MCTEDRPVNHAQTTDRDRSTRPQLDDCTSSFRTDDNVLLINALRSVWGRSVAGSTMLLFVQNTTHLAEDCCCCSSYETDICARQMLFVRSSTRFHQSDRGRNCKAFCHDDGYRFVIMTNIYHYDKTFFSSWQKYLSSWQKYLSWWRINLSWWQIYSSSWQIRIVPMSIDATTWIDFTISI